MNTKRKTVIAGNWKMNMTPGESIEFVDELKTLLKDKTSCETVVCVPDVDIASVSGALAGSKIKLGAQNAHWELKGAFTGETSVNMLKEYNVEYVIIGHSERRQHFGEKDSSVNKRLKTILAAGLKAIVCVGESIEEREMAVTAEVVSLQTKEALHEIAPEQMKNVIIAYEPIWAIRTGKPSDDERVKRIILEVLGGLYGAEIDKAELLAIEADRVNGIIRDLLTGLYTEEIAQATTIQYGGSMDAENAAKLLAKPNVDGGLIGTASLKSKDFAAIVDAAKR